jgi:hypothetical protein
MVKFLNQKLLSILFLPIILNAFSNFIKKALSNNIYVYNFYDGISLFILFFLLLVVGSLIKSTLNLRSISFSILVFLCSFFVLDAILLFFYKLLTFNDIFLIVNFAWLTFFVFKKEYLRSILALSAYYLLDVFNNMNIDMLTSSKNIIGDVDVIFYLQTKNIYEKSYYFSVNNFVFEGYPQFTSYIQALFSRFLVNLDSYVYLSISSQIIFLLSILFFLELKISRFSKIFVTLLFSSLILNSGWLQFLFTSSLMSEGIVSLFSAVVFYELFNSHKNIPLTFFVLGILYFTKQFLILIVVVLLLYFSFNKNLRKYVFIGFLGLFLKENLYMFVFKDLNSSHHLSQIDISLTLKELITFTNLKLVNIKLIGENIYVDKPLTILLISLVILFISHTAINKKVSRQIMVYMFIIIFNLLCILSLYISAWKNMELESPIRFIWSFLHLKLTLISLLLESNNSEKLD